ncbi:MAG: ParB/RepB/Spo0J family partition protein [Peptococcaceae bacterium]|jgi:ParB/RepB/Spo0J family partition protein|nr:ParB/RepB/Spo0J family partition protein [Peptococcaceae bacterium]
MALALVREAAEESAPVNVLQLLPVASIQPNTRNPRKDFPEEALQELATSIREVGILQPLVVVPAGPDQYRLVAGERRWRAAQIAGLVEVPALIRDLTPEQEAQAMLIENLQRRDLNAIEEAQAYQELIAEHGYTQETLAAKIGVSQGQISNRIRLLGLPAAVTESISLGTLSAGHGRVLAGFKELPSGMLKKAADRIAEKGIPVARAAEEVKELIGNEGRRLFSAYGEGPQFNTKQCEGCSHRAMGKEYFSGDEKPFCVKPSCYYKKQEEAHNVKVAKAVKAMSNQDMVDIGKLRYGETYTTWREMNPNSSAYYDQTECQTCAKRKFGKRQDQKTEEAELVCLDPKCMEKKRNRTVKDKEKAKADGLAAEAAEVQRLVQVVLNSTMMLDDNGDDTQGNGAEGIILGKRELVALVGRLMCEVDSDYDHKITRTRYMAGFGITFPKNSCWDLTRSSWPGFCSQLEKLSLRQLWQIIIEWPALAQGPKGPQGYILQRPGTDRFVYLPQASAEGVSG